MFALALSRSLGDRPLARRLGGRRLALFRDASGRARALEARCAHRGADLAAGRVVDGCLECPYHGWRYDSGGRCVRVPAQPGRPVPDAARVEAFDVVEQQGILWVGAAATPPRFALLEHPAFRRFELERTAPGRFDWWLENFIDLAHVPFVHRRTFGGRRFDVETGPVQRRDDGFSVRVVASYGYRLATRILHGALSAYTEDITFDVRPPAVHATIELGRGRREALVLAAAPEDDATSRLIVVVGRNFYTRMPFADTVGRWFARAVLAEDARVAAGTQDGPRASTASDAPGLELARLLRRG